MSVDSPTPRENTSVCSKHRRLDVAVAGPPQRGGRASRGPPGTCAESGGSRSNVPLGAGRCSRTVRHIPRRGARAGPRPPPRPGTGWRPARGRSSSAARDRTAPRSSRRAAGTTRAASRASRPEPPGRSTRPTEPANSTSPGKQPGASPGRQPEHHRPLGMPGRVRDGQLRPGQRQPLAVVERLDVLRVGQPHARDQRRQRRAVPARRVGQHAAVLGVDLGGHVVRAADRHHRGGVVQVPVGEDDGDRLEPCLSELPGERLDGVRCPGR